MHSRAYSVLVIVVVTAVVAAPAAGAVSATATAAGSAPAAAVDGPSLDGGSDAEDHESSDWLQFAIDDHDEEDEEEDSDDDRDDEDDDREDDGDREEADEDGYWDWDWDDDEEREDDEADDDGWSWWSDDDDDRGAEDDRERGGSGNGKRGAERGNGNPGNGERGAERGNGNPENGKRGAERGNGNPGNEERETDDSTESGGTDDERASNEDQRNDDPQSSEDLQSADDPQPGDDQQSGQSNDDDRAETDQPSNQLDEDGTSEDRPVRVDYQESDESQEGDDGEANETETGTENGTVEPGPDIGSANVTVLQTPVVVGQPLVVSATTTNKGTEAGRKVVQFEVEHEIVDQRSFVLQPNETRTVTFTHVFETPGNKTFEVDAGLNRFVTVAERRPNLSVSTVEVVPESVEAGEDVTITAVVNNTGYANGSLPVALELFGEVVAVQNVTLATGETREVSFTRTVQAPGTYEAVIGNESVEFQVTGDPVNGSTAATNESVLESAAETPGFGPVVALAGVVVAVALALGRRE